MTQALITGASGFVGANLVEMIAQRGWSARGLVRKSSNVAILSGVRHQAAYGDVTDLPSLVAAMKDVDVVFHVAAVANYWNTSRDAMYNVNVQGTRNVLQAARICGVRRVIFTSSVASLGVPEFGTMRDEFATFDIAPSRFYYGHSKFMAEQAVVQAVSEGQDVVVVNPAVIMGPRDVNVIGGGIVVQAARHGIPAFTDGGICVVDVSDACAGHIAAYEHGASGARYILGGENVHHQELANLANGIAGRKPRPMLRIARAPAFGISHVMDGLQRLAKIKFPLSGDQLRYSCETFWFDSSRARHDLGLTTRPLRETVERTFAWYKANGVIE